MTDYTNHPYRERLEMIDGFLAELPKATHARLDEIKPRLTRLIGKDRIKGIAARRAYYIRRAKAEHARALAAV